MWVYLRNSPKMWVSNLSAPASGSDAMSSSSAPRSRGHESQEFMENHGIQPPKSKSSLAEMADMFTIAENSMLYGR